MDNRESGEPRLTACFVIVSASSYDLYTPLLQIFLLIYIRIDFSISFLYLFLSFRRLFVYDILVQIQYGTCNSIVYVLNYLCQVSLLDPPLMFLLFWLADQLYYTSKEVFFLRIAKAFLFFPHSWYMYHITKNSFFYDIIMIS